MNEEQSEKLLKVLQNINNNIKKLSQEKEKNLIFEKEFIKSKLLKFVEHNKDLKVYDLKYLESILKEEKFSNSYLFLKKNFERGLKNE